MHMKTTHLIWYGLVAAAVLAPAAVRAEGTVTNRLTFSARFGFNISAKFKGFGAGAPAHGPRTTPRGDAYNYDDGYVLTDISGNYGGQTWYWGYDNSARQISGNTILLNRSASDAPASSGSQDSEPNVGAELVFSRELGSWGRLHYGFEAAANYMTLSIQDNNSFVSRVTDAYAFTPGTMPPAATPPNSYQGSYEGPGFVIGDTPISSSTTTISQRRFDCNIWGFRLGPYLETPLGKGVNVSLSAGLAVGLVDGTTSWTQTVALTGGASTSTRVSASDLGVVWGGYAAANLSWQFSQRWSAVGGVQYQNLGQYAHSFNGQKVNLDLRNSLFVTLGLTYNF
jgi:hypothetical protein